MIAKFVKPDWQHIQARIDTRREFQARLIERRALSADEDIHGAYLLSGETLQELLGIVKNYSIMRTICQTLPPVAGNEVDIPTLEEQLSDAEWTPDGHTVTDDTTEPFGQVCLYPHQMCKQVKISRKLLRKNPEVAGQMVLEAIGAAIATPQERAFIRGLGHGEPQGLLNTPGLPVYETAASGLVTEDDIINWVYSLPAVYTSGARILTKPSFIKKLRSLKDGNGNKVFPAFGGTLENVPVVYSDGLEDFVNASTGAWIGGKYAAVIGNFRMGYAIADSADTPVTIALEELYAGSNQMAYQVWYDTDGACMLPNAFYALKVKA